MHPLLIVAGLFAMSLCAAVVLFKWLENTAVVRVPFGRFGGGIAGFIGVFLILQQSYTALAAKDTPPSLSVPAGYEAFISERYGLGVGYPKEFELNPVAELRMIGNLQISDERANIGIGLEALQGDELEEMSRDEARDILLDSNVSTITMMMTDIEVLGRTPYSMNAIKGEKLELRVTRDDVEYHTVQVVIPHFENQAIYYFTLSTTPEHLKRDQAVFDDILSTVRFF